MNEWRSECGPIRFRDPGALGQPSHHPSSGVPGQALAVVAEEDRPFEPLSDRQIEGPGSAWCEGDDDSLAALAVHHQGAVAPVEAELVDVGTERLGDPQTVQRQQRTQRMIVRRRQSSLDKERAELVAVETDRVRLVVQLRTPHMHSRGVFDDAFLAGVPVEPGQRRQPTPNRGRRLAFLLELPGVQLDVGARDLNSPRPCSPHQRMNWRRSRV